MMKRRLEALAQQVVLARLLHYDRSSGRIRVADNELFQSSWRDAPSACYREGWSMDSSGQEKKTAVPVPSEIAQNLKVADENATFQYDESARNIVAQKSVLAYILKSALDEYAAYTVQEIAERFIEGEPELRKIAVHQDHPDRQDDPSMMSGDDKIEGKPTADKSQRDGTVYFDIRFIAVLPSDGSRIEILINCEIQNNDTPGYPIPKRGIYYTARMISSQRGTIFKDQEYGKIKKVVSIWLCEDTADARSDTINSYSFTEECLRGNFHEAKKDYDLMTVVVLRLGRKGEESEDNAIRLLSKMFSTNLSYEDKLDALQNEFKISVSREMSEEVQNVCNLSMGVLNKGEMKKAKAMAYRLWKKGMSCEEIADVAEVDTDTVREWLAECEEMLVK